MAGFIPWVLGRDKWPCGDCGGRKDGSSLIQIKLKYLGELSIYFVNELPPVDAVQNVSICLLGPVFDHAPGSVRYITSLTTYLPLSDKE